MNEKSDEPLLARPEDRPDFGRGRGGPPLIPIVLVLLVAAGLAVYWFYGSGDSEEPAPPPVVAPQPQPEPPPAPDIPPIEPEAEPAEAVAQPAPEPEPVPEPVLTLETSDEVVVEELSAAGADELLANGLTYESLVDRGAALVESLSRGQVPHKLLRINPPQEKFSVQEQGDVLYLDPASYRRYDDYADAVASLDTEQLAGMFHHLRPLLEQVFEAQGFPADEFDNTLIRALDRIIAAPSLAEPPQVKSGIKSYKYVDPELEGLPELEKQLLRMGPENTAKIQAQARALREALLGPVR